MSTGQIAAYTTITTSVRVSSCTINRTRGINTTAGNGRRNSISGASARSAPLSVPSSRPTGTAMAIVIAIACAHTDIVSPTLATNAPFLTSPAALLKTVVGSGKAAGLTRPAARASWAAPNRKSRPAAPRPARDSATARQAVLVMIRRSGARGRRVVHRLDVEVRREGAEPDHHVGDSLHAGQGERGIEGGQRDHAGPLRLHRSDELGHLLADPRGAGRGEPHRLRHRALEGGHGLRVLVHEGRRGA